MTIIEVLTLLLVVIAIIDLNNDRKNNRPTYHLGRLFIKNQNEGRTATQCTVPFLYLYYTPQPCICQGL